MVRPRRMIRSAALLGLALFAVGVLPADAQVQFAAPQARINWVDTSAAPKIRVFVSFVDRFVRPVPMKLVRKVEVLRHKEGGGSPEVWRSFSEGVSEGGKDGELLVFSKADEARDVVIVVAGHQDPALMDGDLGSSQRAGLDLFFKKLGAKDRVNVIWYNDRLYTYVYKQGKTGELSDLEDTLGFCREKALESYVRWGQPPEEAEEGGKEGEKDEKAPADPCGLLEDYSRLEKILKSMPYRGFYPRLFGFTPSSLCIPPKHEPISHRGPGGGEESKEVRAGYGAAIDEAFRLLVRKGEPGRPKLLLILSDGKEGYLEAQEDCRLKSEADVKKDIETQAGSCRELGRGAAASRCRSEAYKSRDKLSALMKAELDKRLVLEQQRFRDERLGKWLALAQAADIKVFAVGYPNGSPHERERLEILAYKTGGTYREVTDPAALGDMVSSLLDELANQYVVAFDGGLKPNEDVTVSVKLQIPGVGSIATEPYSTKVPAAVGGPERLAKEKLRWLELKVGSPWHIVILVVAAILALFLVYLFLKLLLALLKALFGKAKKKAAGAAKAGQGALAARAKAAAAAGKK